MDLALNDAGADPAGAPTQRLTLDARSQSAGADGRILLPGDVVTYQVTASFSGLITINQTAKPGDFLGDVQVTQPGNSFFQEDTATMGGMDPEHGGKGFSRLSFGVSAGQTLLIRVSGVGSSFGDFHLDVKEFATSGQSLATQDLTEGASAQQMVASLLGPDNATVQLVPGSATYSGAGIASGLFTGGSGILNSREKIGATMDTGVVLTNGDTANVIGPNDNEAASMVNGVPGSSLLDQFVRGGTLDASTLTFQIIPQVNVIQLSYVFASEEYGHYVGSAFDDVFGIFVNGENYARVPGTGTPLAGTGQAVTVNTINARVNSAYFIDNSFSPSGGFGHLNTQMNGLTRVLTLLASVRAGQVNTITLTIADTLDPQVDSAVFLAAGSLMSLPEHLAPSTGQQALAQLLQTASYLADDPRAAALTTTERHFLFQQAVVDDLIRSDHLTGDYLIFPIDPVDATLTGPGGLQVSMSTSQGISSNIANVFFAASGANQLVVIPNANPGLYEVSLAGVGAGESLFGASFVSASGQVTSVLLHGSIAGATTSAVLDFQNLDGRLEQDTLTGSAPISPADTSLAAATPIASLLGALSVLLTPVTIATATSGSSAFQVDSASFGAALAQAIGQSLGSFLSSGAGRAGATAGQEEPLQAAKVLDALEAAVSVARDSLESPQARAVSAALQSLYKTLGPGLAPPVSLLGHVGAFLGPILQKPVGSRISPKLRTSRAHSLTDEMTGSGADQPGASRLQVAVPVVVAGIALARLANRRTRTLAARRFGRTWSTTALRTRRPGGDLSGSTVLN